MTREIIILAMIKCHVSLSEKKQQEMHYKDEKQLTLTLQSEHYNNKKVHTGCQKHNKCTESHQSTVWALTWGKI